MFNFSKTVFKFIIENIFVLIVTAIIFMSGMILEQCLRASHNQVSANELEVSFQNNPVKYLTEKFGDNAMHPDYKPITENEAMSEINGVHFTEYASTKAHIVLNHRLIELENTEVIKHVFFHEYGHHVQKIIAPKMRNLAFQECFAEAFSYLVRDVAFDIAIQKGIEYCEQRKYKFKNKNKDIALVKLLLEYVYVEDYWIPTAIDAYKEAMQKLYSK